MDEAIVIYIKLQKSYFSKKFILLNYLKPTFLNNLLSNDIII